MINKGKPSLTALFIASCRYTAMLDAQNINQTLIELKRENDTFYERTLKTFDYIASEYYDDKVINEWVKEAFLDIKHLPKIREGDVNFD